MKKTLSLLLAVLFISALTLCINAADSAKADIYAAFFDACPEYYRDQYLPAVQSTLDQITVTDEQAQEVIPLINDAKEIIIGTTDSSVGEEITKDQTSDEADISPDKKEQIKDLVDNSAIDEQIKDVISDAIAVESTSSNGELSDAQKQEQVIAIVNDACTILGLTAKIDAKAIATDNPTDIKLDIYNEGKKVATIDTPVKLTGGTKTTGIAPIFVALFLSLIGITGTVILRRYEF